MADLTQLLANPPGSENGKRPTICYESGHSSPVPEFSRTHCGLWVFFSRQVGDAAARGQGAGEADVVRAARSGAGRDAGAHIYSPCSKYRLPSRATAIADLGSQG